MERVWFLSTSSAISYSFPFFPVRQPRRLCTGPNGRQNIFESKTHARRVPFTFFCSIPLEPRVVVCLFVCFFSLIAIRKRGRRVCYENFGTRSPKSSRSQLSGTLCSGKYRWARTGVSLLLLLLLLLLLSLLLLLLLLLMVVLILLVLWMLAGARPIVRGHLEMLIDIYHDLIAGIIHFHRRGLRIVTADKSNSPATAKQKKNKKKNKKKHPTPEGGFVVVVGGKKK